MTTTWTHLIRFVARQDGQVHLGQLVDTTRDVGLDSLASKTIQAYRIEGSIFDQDGAAAAKVTRDILTVKTLLSPIARDQCPYIRCIGMNYSGHAKVSISTQPLDGRIQFERK